MSLQELAAKRLQAIADARKINDKATAEKRQMNAEEAVQFDKFMDEADSIKKQMVDAQTAEKRAKRLESADDESKELLPRQTTDGDPSRRGRNAGGDDAPEHGEIRHRLRRSGQERVYQLRGPTASPEYRAAFGRFLRSGTIGPELVEAEGEARALSADSSPDGGYLVAPQQMVAGIFRTIDDQVHMRQLATVIQVPTANSLGIPTQETNPGDADWTAEVTEVQNDSTIKFGKRELKPSPISKAIDVSRTLMRRFPAIESHVQDRLAYKFGVTFEKAYLTGNGAGRPLGVFTASANGISTGRDVTCGSTTAITDTGIIDLFYSLKAGYRADPSCAWLLHRDAIKQIRKLKDNQGGYLWKPGRGLEGNDGDRLLEKQVLESEFAPNTFTTGLYVAMIAAWRYYYIADSLQFEVQRLEELKARTNQVEFIGRAESDGMPTFEEAFARGALA